MKLWDIYSPSLPDFVAAAVDAPEMRRLEHVGMNCGCEYTSFPLFQQLREPYSRFDHSVGVALLIWRFTGDARQTLAGLFHDIATPCFAHVVDFMLGDSMKQEATEDGTRPAIEGSKAIQAVLRGLGLATDDVADYHLYPVADNDSPRLSADRLEYTLGNLVNYGLISRDRAAWMLDALAVLRGEDGRPELGFARLDAALAFARGALDTGRIYVSEPDRFSMQTLAVLLMEALRAGAIDMADLWRDEPFLIAKLCRNGAFEQKWARYCRYSRIVHDPGGIVVRAKKRYIDPLVRGMGRVSQIDPAFDRAVSAFLQESQQTPLAGL